LLRNSYEKTNPLLSIVSRGLGTIFLIATPAIADNTLFFDDFNSPTLNSAWQAWLPNANLAAPCLGSPESASYVGAPNYTFQTLNGYSILNMNDSMSDLQRRGWSTSTIFNAPGFMYETRFNTLTQSSATSIDACLELWIFDAANPSLYDIVSPFEEDATQPTNRVLKKPCI
jgi:hypothetical protein